jgi:dynamin GTPase
LYQLILEADGYQPYLLSPEKGLKALIQKALELAKDPLQNCVDEESLYFPFIDHCS